MKNGIKKEAYTQLLYELNKGEKSGYMSEKEFLKKVNIEDE